MWIRSGVAALALTAWGLAIDFLEPAWLSPTGRSLSVGLGHASSQWGLHEESVRVIWNPGIPDLGPFRGEYGFGWMGFDPAQDTPFTAGIHRLALGGDLFLGQGRWLTRLDATGRLEVWDGGTRGLFQVRLEERVLFEKAFVGATLSVESARLSQDVRLDPTVFAGLQLPQGLQLHGQVGFLGQSPDSWNALDRMTFSCQAIYGWSFGNRLTAGVRLFGKSDLRLSLGYRQQMAPAFSSLGFESLSVLLSAGVVDGMTAEVSGVFRQDFSPRPVPPTTRPLTRDIPIPTALPPGSNPSAPTNGAKLKPISAVVTNTPVVQAPASNTTEPRAESNGVLSSIAQGNPTNGNAVAETPATNQKAVPPAPPEPKALAMAPLCNETGDAAYDPLTDIFPALFRQAARESFLGPNLKTDRSLDQILYFMRQQWTPEIDPAIRQILLDRFAVRRVVVSRLFTKGKSLLLQAELIDLKDPSGTRRAEGTLPAEKGGYGALAQTLMDHLLDPYGK